MIKTFLVVWIVNGPTNIPGFPVQFIQHLLTDSAKQACAAKDAHPGAEIYMAKKAREDMALQIFFRPTIIGPKACEKTVVVEVK